MSVIIIRLDLLFQINKIVMHKVLIFYPFPWCNTCSSTISLGLRAGSLILVVVCVWERSFDKSSASAVVCWEEYDACVDGFFFLQDPLGAIFMFPSALYSFFSFYLYFFFIGLQLQVTSKFTIFGLFYVC